MDQLMPMMSPQQGQMPGPMDMAMLIQQLANPMAAAGAPQPVPFDAQQAALMSLLTRGGMQSPTASQTPEILALIQMLTQGGAGGGMPPAGMPMAGPPGMMGGMGGAPPMY